VCVAGQFRTAYGDEVWTIYGQNAYVLEIRRPCTATLTPSPRPREVWRPGVAAPRPKTTTVTVQLKGPGGRGQGDGSGSVAAPYYASFGSETIYAGDFLRITIDYGGAVAV